MEYKVTCKDVIRIFLYMNDGKFYISHCNNTMQIFDICIIKIGTESLMHT